MAFILAAARLREEMAVRLLGAHAVANLATLEVVRIAMTAYAAGEVLRVGDYQRRLKGMASRNAIRAGIDHLVDRGILVVDPDPADRRAHIVQPTVHMIEFENREIPLLRARMDAIFIADAAANGAFYVPKA